MKIKRNRTKEDENGEGMLMEKKSNKDIKIKSLKIIVIYFLFGCSWIILTDYISDSLFIDRSSILAISIVKGLLYVLVTSILLLALIYPAYKRAKDSRDIINKFNAELEDSNELYKDLCRELEKKQTLLNSLLNSIPDAIFYKDINYRYLGCNKAFENYARKSEEEILGHSDYDVFDTETAVLHRKMDIEVMNQNISTRNEEVVIMPGGSKIFLETLKTPYYDSDENIIGLIGISRDITERKKKEEKILFLSHHDQLTGLYNRTFLETELVNLDSASYLPLSVIVGDINGLKIINDSFGHAAGDMLIADVSEILKSCCRDTDIIARTGGDELTVLLPNTGSEDVQIIVEKIKQTCETQTAKNPYANIALGYATKTESGEPIEKVIQTAEELMYKHKLFEYKSLRSSILSSIKRTMFEKSNETEEHAERLAKLSRQLGQALNLPEEELVALELLSTIHDIGKISIDKNILTKSVKLTDDDWHEIKKHPEVGYRIAQSSPDLVHISEYILTHHERWDGKGYPQGIAGDEIPLLSRILSIVDAFDAMTQDRSYRKAMTIEEAKNEIMKNAGTQFDPVIASIFVETVIS